MFGVRLLLRAAWRGAFVAASFYLIAKVMAGRGGTSPLPLEQAFAQASFERLGEVAVHGALAAMLLICLLRPIPAGPCRAISGGLVMGAAAVVVFHQSTLFVLHQTAGLVPVRGFLFAPMHVLAEMPILAGMPSLYALMLLGGALGGLLALLLRLALVLPDLLVGWLVGALGFTWLQRWFITVPGFDAEWWQWVVINGGWGWGAVFLMRPLALRGGEDLHREFEEPQHAMEGAGRK
ncbi:hypothetical protein BKE38_17780 [Pseudoroseomonas deserti]|uniref:Uncharacterized protein n=1 Tax=Teichococcus deserti TaxID=1817963 RepID=A0A1V2GZ11_9PROT|nr:hypothetical protein [Pseudoroseomonas deserti]ONG50568.1 hypothetical protein BKE38_17780 [Pseudoroseomonas deserti]